MNKIAEWIRTETPAINAAVSALLALILGLGAALTTVQTAAWEAAVAAGLALAAGVFVRPFALSALTGFVSAGATLLAAYGLHSATPGLVSLINGLITAVFALVVVRPQTDTAVVYKARKAAARTALARAAAQARSHP